MKIFLVTSNDEKRARYDVFMSALVAADTPEQAIGFVVSEYLDSEGNSVSEMDLGDPKQLVAQEQIVDYGVLLLEQRG